MLKNIDVICPFNLNLFLKMEAKNDNNEISKIKLFNQTVDFLSEDFHNIVNIKKSRQGNFDIKIIGNTNFSDTSLANFKKIANLFFEYVNIKPENFIIEIKPMKNYFGLNLEESFIAGILLGLNYLCETNLTKRELLLLSSTINQVVPYFIVGGYNKVVGTNIFKINKNEFNKYLIIDTGIKISKDDVSRELASHTIIPKSTNDIKIYNDYLRVMPDELKRLQDFLNKYPDIIYSLSGISSTYFIAYSDHIPVSIMKSLKKNFPEYNLYECQNTSGHKYIIKY